MARSGSFFYLVFASVLMLFKPSAAGQSSPWNPTAPPPKIVWFDNNITVSWLISPFDSVLETTSSLPPSDAWTNVSSAQDIVGDEARVTMPATNAHQFFRLEEPSSLPVFQFIIFYALDLEITPSVTTTVTGRVHCNSNLYAAPNTSLTFQGRVTSANGIYETQSPLDPVSRSPGTVNYLRGHRAGVSPLNLPLSTNNDTTNLHALIEIPPASESTNSLMSLQRYYNKADLIILVSNATVTATSGAYNNFATLLSWSSISNFVQTNITFFDKRETKDIQATEIDLVQFSNSYSYLAGVLGRDVKILYVADLRTQTVSTESGVSLVHGQILPSAGLTIATLNPLYVKGHYNAPASCLGTTNTAPTCPASLVCDAITILSDKWTDGNSTNSSRVANDTTINAAILAGIVPSDGSYYSGGLENFLRLMENWNSRILTFNGSLAALFPSRIATSPFGGAGVYSPPQQRAFSFDFNFKDVNKLPPGTPQLRTAIRAAWNMTQANSTQ